jgi:hypothetical protein
MKLKNLQQAARMAAQLCGVDWQFVAFIHPGAEVWIVPANPDETAEPIAAKMISWPFAGQSRSLEALASYAQPLDGAAAASPRATRTSRIYQTRAQAAGALARELRDRARALEAQALRVAAVAAEDAAYGPA